MERRAAGTVTFDLSIAGAAVTGTMTVTKQDAGAASGAVEQGTVNGPTLSFRVRMGDQAAAFVGELRGEELQLRSVDNPQAPPLLLRHENAPPSPSRQHSDDTGRTVFHVAVARQHASRYRWGCMKLMPQFTALAVAVGAAGPLARQPSPFPAFERHRIDAIGSHLGQTALADIDKDGDLDWVAGTADRAGGNIWWWEYRGPGEWVRHVLGTGHTDVGGALHDVNGDGWLDMLSGSRLLLNTGRPRMEPFRGFDVGTISSHDTIFADIDGDRRMDAVANSDRTGLFWYSIPSDPTRPWLPHTIATAAQHKVHGGIAPNGAGDVDGDGDTDVVTAGAWYENTDGKGGTWQVHRTLDFGTEDKYGVAVRSWLIDLDGDGDLDLVQTEADVRDARVAWFENAGRGRWTRHVIRDRGRQQDFHALLVADFDNDGDADIFSGTAPLTALGRHGCYIWENTAAAGQRPLPSLWREHLVAHMPCHEPAGGDVDGDGDVDIACKPWSTGNEHVYLRNLLNDSRRSVRVTPWKTGAWNHGAVLGGRARRTPTTAVMSAGASTCATGSAASKRERCMVTRYRVGGPSTGAVATRPESTPDAVESPIGAAFARRSNRLKHRSMLRLRPAKAIKEEPWQIR